MKKIVFFLLFVNAIAFAQVPPQGISHRGTVYNTSNVLMQNTAVKIRISILDSSATTGTEVYKEIHSLTTNNQGQYSLNIGQGSSPTVAFNTLNWGVNLKYLKAEIDLTNSATISSPNGSFAVQGSNQLMSVPYALYALNSQVKVFNNIVELRNSTGNINDIVYIKGHTTTGDGGEGNFIWTTLPISNPGFSDNDGTIIRDSSNTTPGWIRIIEDKINVKYFGIKFDNTDATVIQKAIDFAKLNALNPLVSETNKFRDYTKSGSTIFIPAGEYKISTKIVLKYGVSIEGDSSLNTILKVDNLVGPNMVELDNGQIIGANVSNIFFDGGVAPTNSSTVSSSPKNCMYLSAHDTVNTTNGGLWNSTFRNIKIRNFDGNGIVLEGSGIDSQNQVGDYSYTNQDLLFEQVNIARQKDNSNCLLIRGMHGQLTFINCGFDGLVYEGNISSSSYKTSKFFNVAIETRGIQATLIKFLTCTFQYSEYGAYLAYGESVTFDNCWFEYLDIGVAAHKAYNPNYPNTRPSKCVNILNSRFANASGFGSEWEKVINRNVSGGTCVSTEGGSNVNIQNNYVIVSDPNLLSPNSINPSNYFIRNYGLDSKINASNNSFEHPFLGKTLGIANRTLNISGNTLNSFGYKFVTVNCLPASNTINYIKEIKSEISAGETITIRATGTGQIKFDNSKNILYPKTTTPTTNPFILNAKESATFMKIDTPITVGSTTFNETYQLISVIRTF